MNGCAPVSRDGDSSEYDVEEERLVALKVKVYWMVAACANEQSSRLPASGAANFI